MNNMVLSSNSLIMRPISETDLDEVLEIIDDFVKGHLLKIIPDLSRPLKKHFVMVLQ